MYFLQPTNTFKIIHLFIIGVYAVLILDIICHFSEFLFILIKSNPWVLYIKKPDLYGEGNKNNFELKKKSYILNKEVLLWKIIITSWSLTRVKTMVAIIRWWFSLSLAFWFSKEIFLEILSYPLHIHLDMYYYDTFANFPIYECVIF